VLPWGVAGIDLAVFIASLLAWAASGTPLPIFDALTYLVLPLAFGGTGAMLTGRVPGNPIGPMLLAATTGFALLVAGQSYLILGVTIGADLPGMALAAALAGIFWIPSLLIVLIGVPLVFPDGHLLSPRWRWVGVATAVAIIPAEIQTLVSPDAISGITQIPNPLANPDLLSLATSLAGLSAMVAIPIFVVTFASVVIRYRRSDAVGRQQIRWLAASVLVAVVAFSVSFNAPAEVQSIANTVGLIALTGIPVAIGVAVARYRLYEIDRLISRGITYLVLSLLLASAYVAVVLVLEGPLGSVFGGETLPVAISTLVVAALFQPVRGRLQRAMDRRFDRARVDAERTGAAFSERMRDEVDIEAVAADLTATVDGAIRPSGIGLWLRGAVRS